MSAEIPPGLQQVTAWLAEQLADIEGRDVLVLAPTSWLRELAPALPGDMVTFPPEQPVGELPARRFAVGVVAGALECLAPRAGDALLARLRDEYCARVLTVAHETADKGRSEMLALGFTRITEAADGWRLYEHDIASYNPPREWNSPEHWANPENFNRYRW